MAETKKPAPKADEPASRTGTKPVDSIAKQDAKETNAVPGSVESGVRNTGTEERPVWTNR